MIPWTYKQPTGPTLDIKNPGPCIGFPYVEDERSNAEIEQDKFEQMYQQYEFEREFEAGKTTIE